MNAALYTRCASLIYVLLCILDDNLHLYIKDVKQTDKIFWVDYVKLNSTKV